jgi:hypothetical protein
MHLGSCVTAPAVLCLGSKNVHLVVVLSLDSLCGPRGCARLSVILVVDTFIKDAYLAPPPHLCGQGGSLSARDLPLPFS